MTNPYVGPKPLSGDQPIHGREREIADVYNLLIAERIVLLCSPSGAGKSSLISAKNGLLDRMKKHFDVWPVARVHERPPAEAGDVNRYCWSAAKQLSPATALGASTLVEALRPPAGRTVFLVFDQFEEVLTTGQADIEDKREFFRQLGDFLMLPNVWALFSMREDYLAPLDPFRRLLPTHLRNRYRLNLLGKSSAELAIRLPAGEAKRPFTDSAVVRLVHDLAQINVQNEDGSFTLREGPFVEPLHLQLACERIWANTTGQENIGEADVSGHGDVDTALRDFYESKVKAAALDAPESGERAIREWFERCLINPAGIRRQVMLTEGSSEGLPNDRIWELAKGHLIRKEERGATFFELAHDRLIRPVKSSNKHWFQSKLNDLEKRADAWNLRSRPPALLARRKELQQWERQGWKPNRKYEEEYIEASRAAVRAGLLQAAAPWAAGVLLALLSLAAYYFKTAEREKILAESGRLAVSALHFSRKDSAKGLEVAIAAFDKAETLQTIETLHETVQAVAQDRSRFVSHAKPVRVVLFLSEDELVSGGNDGKLVLWKVSTGVPVKTLFETHGSPIEDVRPIPGGKRLLVVTAERVLTIGLDGSGEIEVPAGCAGPVNAAVSRTARWFAIACDNSVVIVDASTNRVHNSIARARVKSLAFGAEEDLVAVAGANNLVELWNAGKAVPRTPALAYVKVRDADNNIRKVAFSPDGSTVAAGGNDGWVTVWDTASGAFKEERLADENGVHAMAFQPVSNTLATGGGSEGLVCHWPVDDGHTTYRAKEGVVESIAFSPSGARMATGAADRMVRVFEASPTQLRKLAQELLSESKKADAK